MKGKAGNLHAIKGANDIVVDGTRLRIKSSLGIEHAEIISSILTLRFTYNNIASTIDMRTGSPAHSATLSIDNI